MHNYEAGLRATESNESQAQRLAENQSGTSFTEQARTVLRLAEVEARHFHHNYIGTEHLLLALIREGEGIAAKVLTCLGVDLAKARDAVAFIIGHGNGNPRSEFPLTPRAQRVIKLATEEARRMDQYAIGPEHLLLGLVLEGEGVGAGVLECLGVNLEKVRRQTREAVGQPDGSALNGCPYCCEDLEMDETDSIGDILFFFDRLFQLLVGTVLCLVATLVLLSFAIVARIILFLLEL